MAKKFFTDESLQTFVDEIKAYTNDAVDEKADATHNHDDIYCTETKIDAKLESKADATHKHTVSQISDLTVTATELNHVDGVKSNIQTQLDGKSDTAHKHDSDYDAKGSANNALTASKSYTDTSIANLINGAPTTLDTLGEIATAMEENVDVVEALEAAIGSKADSSHKHTVSQITDLTATATELNYVDGVTSSIQTQLDGKAPTSHTHTISQISDLTATATELNYMDGVTSNVQTQLDGKANKADIAATAMVSTASGSNTYFKIHDFGAWGTGDWSKKGFSMLITSRAGEMVWVTLASNDSNTSAGAFRLVNRYSKISKIYYHVAESAIYVQCVAWANNLCAHLLTNVYGDYVPKINTASAIPTDAVEINIVEFGINSTSAVVGNTSVKLELGGSADRPTYNSNDLALKSDVNAITLDTLGGNDRYYTETEIDSKVSTLNTAINGKANSSHTHSISNITNLQTTLDGKANSSHGNHVPTTQTASNKVFLRNDNTWQTVTPANIGAVPTSRTVNGKALTGNITLSASDVGAAASSHGHGYIQDGTVGVKASDSNEVNFASNSTYLYFGYDNRLNSTAKVDTYKFGTHSGTASASDGNIECGSLVAGRTLKGGTVTVGNAVTLQYDSTNQCINFVF